MLQITNNKVQIGMDEARTISKFPWIFVCSLKERLPMIDCLLAAQGGEGWDWEEIILASWP